MIKFEICITFKNEARTAEIVTAPDIATAFNYGLNKYGQYKVYAMRYFGKAEATTTL